MLERSHSPEPQNFGPMLAGDSSPTLQLKAIKGSMLQQACVAIKPGKDYNDKIMLAKLEDELKPLTKRAS